ncbi:hypothetical protein AK812_SmicGene18830 [Symbiodinium microadriaticum]|uniref:Uncharacterized protein n=1 Tax=Symbiodinium microadriaticum TaxID=2951 RepID=A0A1Q9DU68_SYMMI|nr:hypothetical protein AK812_SmicGene18830 [Symbiodinium microadriaticum]
MAELSEAMQEARDEFGQFAAYMQQPGVTLQKEEGNAALPTTAGHTPTPSLASAEAMETDREKRDADPVDSVAAASPTKWAKGEAKGEQKDEAQTGKGRAAEAASKQPPQATPSSTAPTQENQATAQTGNQGQGQRGGQQQRQLANWRRPDGYRQWPNRYNDRAGQWESKEAKELRELKEVTKALSRLTIRLEDAIGVQHLDSEFILFLQTEAAGNPWAITQQLYDTAVQWHKQKETNPESLTNPMRNILLYNLYSALLMKLEALEVDQALMDAAKARGLIEGSTYLYLQWDPTARRHVKAAMQPVEHTDMVTMVKTLKYLATFPNVVGRFHALRKMEDNLNGDIIPFSLVVQNRTAESHQLWTIMSRMQRSSIWHLIGATMRPAKPGRSPLAKYVEKGIAMPHRDMGRFLRWLARPLQAQDRNLQHDAAEFLQFLAPLLVSAHVIDQGTLWPMTISTQLACPEPGSLLFQAALASRSFEALGVGTLAAPLGRDSEEALVMLDAATAGMFPSLATTESIDGFTELRFLDGPSHPQLESQFVLWPSL